MNPFMSEVYNSFKCTMKCSVVTVSRRKVCVTVYNVKHSDEFKVAAS